MPHQWLEGNLPVSAKCHICDKTCGSVLRLQDWRCLWCKAMVGSGPSGCCWAFCEQSVRLPTVSVLQRASCRPSASQRLSVLQVHSGCKEQLSSKCPLGQCKVSVIPPTALNSIDSDGENSADH